MRRHLGLILKELQPDLKIEIFERLDIAAAESSMLGIMQELGILLL
jgi:malate dehydrogenase (quinone)